jgi:ATP:corrinoid adenosyltransferase
VARYLGILIADGSRDISGIKLNGFQLSTKDKEIADFLYNNSMLATGGQCCKCMTSRGLYKLTWGLGSFVYVKDNYGLDMSNTADNKMVPELVLKCNRDTILSFMEGLFTDLTIRGSSKNLTLGYICTNEYLRTQVKIILLNLGILTSSKDKQVVTKKYPKGKSYFYTLFRGVECFKLYSTINIPRIKQYMESWEESTFNSNIDVIPANRYLVSKIKGYTYNSNSYNICRNVRRRKWGVGLDILTKYFEESGDKNIEHLLNDRYLWQRVVSIESTGIHPTYDLEVDSTHSYVANGFISHNTTSAFGLVMRAIGQDWNVLVAQFMKGDSTADKTYGELKSCQLFKNHITILQSHDKVPYRVILEHNKSDEDKLLVRETWLSMMDELSVGKAKSEFIETGVMEETFVPYNMLVLDEILGALNLSLISQKTFFEFIREIKESRPDLEIVLTGRMWSEPLYDKIKDISDLMSDIRCVKHYFNKTCTICKRSFEYRSNYCPNCGSELRTVPIREGVDV